MLGALFRIRQQIGLKLLFFIRRGASPTGTSNGTEFDGVAGQADHGFR